MNDVEGALQAAREGTALPPQATRKIRARLLTQEAAVRAAQKDVAAAIALQYQAIDAARDQNDVVAESQAWSELGAILLEADRPAEAEPAILEGYRLRLLNRRDLMQYSYLLLGRLKVQQGDAGRRAGFLRPLH